jgi:hypothetical protein
MVLHRFEVGDQPRPGRVHPSRACVHALDADMSTSANAPSHSKCRAASSDETDLTSTFSPRPSTSAMARVGKPSSATAAVACTRLPPLHGQPVEMDDVEHGSGRFEEAAAYIPIQAARVPENLQSTLSR